MSLQESFVTNFLLCLYLRQDHTAAFGRRQVPAEQEMVERQSQHFRTGGSPERNEEMQKVPGANYVSNARIGAQTRTSCNFAKCNKGGIWGKARFKDAVIELNPMSDSALCNSQGRW
jgi:hypothetical protein